MRFVKAEKPVTTTHAKLGELSVEVEVPQLESLEELAQFAGSADAALVFVNNAIETAAKNGARAMLRNAPEDANREELTGKVQTTSKEYAPSQASRGESQKAKAQKLDSVRDLVTSGKEFTREELMALLEGAK
jgi:hypothetical protein